MNTDQLAADFEQWIIKTFGVTWERSGIMHQFKTAIEKAVEPWEKAYHEMLLDRDSLARHADELRAAHASEQEKWTVDKENKELVAPTGERFSVGFASMDSQRLADLIKSAIEEATAEKDTEIRRLQAMIDGAYL